MKNALKIILGVVAIISIFILVVLNDPAKNVGAAGWYDTNYQYCRKLTMTAGGNVGGVGTTTVAGFALVATSTISSLAATSSAGRIQKFNYASSTPNDVAITSGTDCNSDSGTLLDFYFEKYASTTGAFTLWVEPTDISSSTAKSVLMYYGNTSGTDVSNKHGVFVASGEQGVWDLSEDPSGTAPQIDDASANNNDGTSVGTMTTSDQITGQVDGALDFDGVDDYVNVGTSSSLSGFATKPTTFSAWVKVASGQGGIIVGRSDNNGSIGWLWNIFTNHTMRFTIVCGSGNGRYTTTSTIGNSQWAYVSAVYDGAVNANTKIYIDGVLAAGSGDNCSGAQDSDASTNFTIGRNIYGDSGPTLLTGFLDDVRIYNRTLHVQDIVTIYNNTVNSARFWTFGGEETLSAPAASTGIVDVNIIWFD